MLVSFEIIFFGLSISLFFIKLGLIKFPPLLIAAYKDVACRGVVVIPCPKETVSNLHLFHLNSCGTPTSSSSIDGFLRSFVFFMKSLYLSSPIFFARIAEPTLEDLTKISSTDKFFGCSFRSEIS